MEKKIALHLGIGKGEKISEISPHFFHVVAVDPEPFLAPNNVTICPFAVFSKKTSVFLRSKELKEKSVPSLTLKQIIHDYIYAKDDLKDTEISHIFCDLEGFEEHVLEDLFYFAYFNNCSLSISFYPERWQNHTLSEFSPLFSYFTSHPENPSERNRVFTPKKTEKFFLKKNIPVLILCYNQLTFLKNMVRQLEKYTQDIIVIDNNSTYQPLLDYYEEEFCYTLLRQKENFGHLIYRSPFMRKLTGEVYLLTDPDLQLNPNLPDNFIEKLFAISLYFRAIRVGSALKIDADDLREGKFFCGHSIRDWEIRFWQYPLIFPEDPGMELYEGLIDTTFCLVNRRFEGRHIRVAKDYTCIHIPWHKNFEKMLLPGEYEAYLVNNKSTTYWS